MRPSAGRRRGSTGPLDLGCGVRGRSPRSRRGSARMIMSRFDTATRSYNVAHVSYGVIGNSVWSIRSPASTPSASQMSELPVARSPWIKAQLMGALPRLCGSREAWAPIIPIRAVRSVSGCRIWLQPITNTTSSSMRRNSSSAAGSLMFATGWSGRWNCRHSAP